MTERVTVIAAIISLIAVSVGNSGCVVHEDAYYRNTAAIENLGAPPSLSGIHHIKGVSIDFSGITDWRVLSENEEFFAAYKRLRAPFYTSALVVMVVHPPKARYSNDQEFVTYAKQAVTFDHYNEIDRLSFQMEAGRGKWLKCLKYYKKYSTKDEKNAPNTKLLEEDSGYICQHPFKDGLFVRIDYSERYPADADVFQFLERSDQVMKNINFE